MLKPTPVACHSPGSPGPFSGGGQVSTSSQFDRALLLATVPAAKHSKHSSDGPHRQPTTGWHRPTVSQVNCTGSSQSLHTAMAPRCSPRFSMGRPCLPHRVTEALCACQHGAGKVLPLSRDLPLRVTAGECPADTTAWAAFAGIDAAWHLELTGITHTFLPGASLRHGLCVMVNFLVDRNAALGTDAGS